MFDFMGFEKFFLSSLAVRRRSRPVRIDGLSRSELLEERLVLASEINVVFTDGNLTVTGSGEDDSLTATITNTNSVVLSITDGTFTGDHQGPDPSSALVVTGALKITLNGGNDSVTLVGVAGTYNGPKLAVVMGEGNDSLSMTGTLAITKEFTVLAGTGNDIVNLGETGGSLSFASKLSLDLGVGDDTLNTAGMVTLFKDFTALTGAGNDALSLGTTAGTTFKVHGGTRIDAGDGNDTVTLGTSGTATLNGVVAITLGGGNDTLTIGDNAASVAFGPANNYALSGGGSAGDRFLGSKKSLTSYKGGSPTSKANAKVASRITGFKLFS